jgi:2-polyprenyl-3-methyl-5-hydroxy-6-metoxy-1,4-benzoquinol methylase
MSLVVQPDAGLAGAHAPEDAPMRAADANRAFYADHAVAYDSSEHCVAHDKAQRLLERVLADALAACATAEPRTLDACGGTGNVSTLLARRGVRTTVVDVSPEMLARWSAKAESLGVPADVEVAEVDEFLARDERSWDLIVFSSALHHLDDYAGVVAAAYGRLAPGGVLVTAFDPIQADDRLTQRLRRFDYLLSLAASPRALAASLRRKSERRSSGGVNIGELAEKHALDGVDEGAVVARLQEAGAEIVAHERYASQRYRLTELLFRALRRTTTFHLIARKPGQPKTT